MNGLQEHLSNPAAITHFLKTYTDERKRLAAQGVKTRADLERRLAAVTGELKRTTRACIESSAPISTFDEDLVRLSGEKQRLEDELAALAEPVDVVTLHPGAVTRYLETVSDLAAALRAGQKPSDLALAIRDLVHAVTIHPPEPGQPVRIDVQGKLEALIGAPPRVAGLVVAGEGFEPPTSGL